jgi:3-(3-hydroxy-phenyl)propionate hydroxylase
MTADTRHAWKALGGVDIVIADGDTPAAGNAAALQEHNSLFSEWMRAAGVEAVVVRPDRYVFGGAATAKQLNTLLRQLISRLAAGSMT